jgi:predicted transcriptional regulator
VSRYLSKDQAQQCQRWVDNDRRLRELVARLEAIGTARLEADQRSD